MPQTLAQLSQSLFSTLGLAGTSNSLEISSNEGRRECLLLVDGLGKNAIAEYSQKTKFLKGLDYRETLSATFPSTTATSLTSLGTGVSPGEHGMVGYTMRVPHSGTPERILNALKWDERVDPVIWQQTPTLFERANRAGIRTSHVAGKRYADTGFTRAALRGGIYLGANSIEELSSAAAHALEDAYIPALPPHQQPGEEAAHGAADHQRASRPRCPHPRLLPTCRRHLQRGREASVKSAHAGISFADRGRQQR